MGLQELKPFGFFASKIWGMGCKPHKCPPRATARLIAKALRSVATMQGVKLADENCASNLSAAEASEFIVRFFQKSGRFFFASSLLTSF
jgi:hypothetical protein